MKVMGKLPNIVWDLTWFMKWPYLMADKMVDEIQCRTC